MAHSKIDNFTKEELGNIVKECWSFRELSRRLGYTSTGANNQTIRRKLSEYNISTEHFTGKAKNKIALASHYAKQKKIARRARQDYNTAATLDSINKLKSFGGGFGKFAKGGQPGGNDDINVSVVGEEGPEVLLHGPNKKGTIIPADQAINVKLVGVEEAAQKALTPKDGIQNVNLVGQDDPITTYAMGPQFNQYTDSKTKILKALRTPNKLVSSEDIAQDIGDKDGDDNSDTKEKEKSSMWDKIKDFLKKGAGLAAIAGLAGLLMKNWDKIKDFI